MSHPSHLLAIVDRFGGQNAMARALGTSQGTIWGWLRAGHVPSRRVPQVIEAAARLDPPVRLSPADFFPPMSGAA